MMTRLLLPSFCTLIVLLLPVPGWALNESVTSPSEQLTPATSSPTKTTPTQVVPVTTLPTPNTVSNSISAPVSIVKQAPISIKPPPFSSAQDAPAKPVHTLIKRVKILPSPSVPEKTETSLSVQSKTNLIQATPEDQTTDSRGTLTSHAVDIEVFVREDCPNCEKAKDFLEKLKNLQPQLKINIRDVRKEPAALELLKRVAQNQGHVALDYPAFVVSGQLLIGFTDEADTAQLILHNLSLSHSAGNQGGITEECDSGKAPGCSLIPATPVVKTEKTTIDLLGYSIPLVQIGLPLFTVTMGLLDGLNHGSTWVLLLMISLLAPLKDRSRMLGIAGTFIAVQAAFYFIVLAAWLNVFEAIDISLVSQFIVAGVAVIAALLYLKKYMNFGQRLILSSQEISKPGIYTRIRKIIQARSILAALFGTVVLAIFVQVIEFSFTSVFPALYTKVLTMQKLSNLTNYGYLALYDFAYMLDDLILLSIGIVTLNQARQHEKESRGLILISGLGILGTAVYLLLA